MARLSATCSTCVVLPARVEVRTARPSKRDSPGAVEAGGTCACGEKSRARGVAFESPVGGTTDADEAREGGGTGEGGTWRW